MGQSGGDESGDRAAFSISTPEGVWSSLKGVRVACNLYANAGKGKFYEQFEFVICRVISMGVE
ncbi:MAG: hypothetical protein IJ324_00025 [Lachnospiraceae bacterium]|nr:hypothetical protein [Lachnospiraceae bacterium]